MPFTEWLRAAGTVVGMSALPVLELKASIPVGLAMGLPLWETFLIAVIGSTIPVPFILLLLRPFFRWCKGRPFFHGIAEKLEGRFRKKASGVRKYSLLGLFLFVRFHCRERAFGRAAALPPCSTSALRTRCR